MKDDQNKGAGEALGEPPARPPLRKSLLQRGGFAMLLLVQCLGLMLGPGFAYAAMAVVVLAGIAMEKRIPYSDNTPSSEDRRLDTLFSLLTLLVAPVAGVGIPLLISSLPTPNAAMITWPATYQFLPALLLSGLLPYWLHRISHESSDFLWRVHSVHHAPHNVYWLNALRLHPINTLYNSAAGLLPLLLLGFDSEVIFAVGILNSFMSIVNHFNVDFRLGWLNWVFNSGELHRWHHSRAPEFGNSNYSGGLLIFWDLVAGTFRLPQARLRETDIGMFDESEYPLASFRGQLMHPFRFWRNCCRPQATRA